MTDITDIAFEADNIRMLPDGDLVTPFRAITRSADWAKYTQPFWAPMGGLAMTLASLNRDLGQAAGSGAGAHAEVRLTLALATIAQAREALDALQMAVAQAREEARR